MEVIPYEEKALKEFEITPAEVALKAKEYLALKVFPDDPQSYRVARAAHTALVSMRTAGDKRRKTLGEDARKWVSAVNDTYKRLFAPLLPAEEHLAKELALEDGRSAKVKATKAAEEKARIDGIQARISTFRGIIPTLAGKTVDELTEIMDKVFGIATPETVFVEFTDEAKKIKEEVIIAIDAAITARLKQDREDEARKIEAERLAKQRAEQEAIAKAQAEEHRKLKEAGDKLNAEKKAEADRIARAQWEENARIKAEKEAREKVEREEKERKTREEAAAKAKAEREVKEAAKKARQEALRPDKEKLIMFADKVFALAENNLSVESKEARRIFHEALDEIMSISKKIKKEAEGL